MTARRDSLPADPARDRCITAAGRIIAAACQERDLLAATHGTRAAAESIWYPGHPLGSVDAIQARYEELQADAVRQRAA